MFFEKKYILKITFIIISLFILILPIFKINKDSVSRSENKVLSAYIPFYNKDKKIFNKRYGHDFENWLKDRFWGRLNITKINRDIKYFISGRYVKLGTVFLDKKKKIMYKDLITNSIPHYKRQYDIERELQKFNEYCKTRDIKFYLVILPQKEMILQPEITQKNRNIEVKKSILNINKNNDIKIAFPFDKFIKNVNSLKYPLFFMTDIHLTTDGIFIGYNTLMNLIKKDYPDIKIPKQSDFEYYYSKKTAYDTPKNFFEGEECRLSGLSNSICSNIYTKKYRYYKHKHSEKLIKKQYDNGTYIKFVYFYPEGYNKKVLIFGDSSIETLMDIIPYSFKHITKIRLNGFNYLKEYERFKVLKYYENEINNFKPDIIILFIDYYHLNNLTLINAR